MHPVTRIVSAEPFPKARNPVLKPTIDFGPAIGARRSSAQIIEFERLEAAVVDFTPRQIGPFMREVLTLGLPNEQGAVVRVALDKNVTPGARLFDAQKRA